jgi:hypothetical protein
MKCKRLPAKAGSNFQPVLAPLRLGAGRYQGLGVAEARLTLGNKPIARLNKRT